MRAPRFIVHESRGFLGAYPPGGTLSPGSTFTVHDSCNNYRTVGLFRCEDEHRIRKALMIERARLKAEQLAHRLNEDA